MDCTKRRWGKGRGKERERGREREREKEREIASNGGYMEQDVNGGLKRRLAAGRSLVGGLGRSPRGRCISHTLASLSSPSLPTSTFLSPFLRVSSLYVENGQRPSLCTAREHFHVGIFNSTAANYSAALRSPLRACCKLTRRWQVARHRTGNRPTRDGTLRATPPSGTDKATSCSADVPARYPSSRQLDVSARIRSVFTRKLDLPLLLLLFLTLRVSAPDPTFGNRATRPLCQWVLRFAAAFRLYAFSKHFANSFGIFLVAGTLLLQHCSWSENCIAWEIQVLSVHSY